MSLPLYELRISPERESFVTAIALVETPAIEEDFIAFSSQQKDLTFSTDEEKMELIGAAMIPDMQIYRRDGYKEFNVFFSKDTIRQIAQVYFQKGFQSNMNLDHSSTPANSYIFQSYIVDQSKGMTSPKGLNLPDGSWVIGVKVSDKEVWNNIKAGKVKGFSVEGIFQLFEQDFNSHIDQDEQDCVNLLKHINSVLLKAAI